MLMYVGIAQRKTHSALPFDSVTTVKQSFLQPQKRERFADFFRPLTPPPSDHLVHVHVCLGKGQN